MTSPVDALLDADFLRELTALRRRLDVRARSAGTGERVARRRGSSAEFDDHRPYAPGDDPRRIDWAVYARTGEPVVKLFRAEEDAALRLVVDASASMGFGSPSKLRVAQRTAAALAFMALSGLERAQLIDATEGRTRVHPASRGRGSIPAFLRAVGALEARGAAEISTSVDAVVRRNLRPGLLAVVSDFLGDGALLASLGRARAAGHHVALVQVVDRAEIEPVLDGDLLLVDAETGATVELSADAGALDAYAGAFEALCEELRRFARRAGSSYVRVMTDEPLEGAVRRFVARSVD